MQIEDRLLSIEAREKKKRKKLRKKKAKERRRVELGITNPAAFLESPELDPSLFALRDIKDGSSLSKVTADEAMDLELESSDSGNFLQLLLKDGLHAYPPGSEDEDFIKPGDDYNTVLEKYLDEL